MILFACHGPRHVVNNKDGSSTGTESNATTCTTRTKSRRKHQAGAQPAAGIAGSFSINKYPELYRAQFLRMAGMLRYFSLKKGPAPPDTAWALLLRRSPSYRFVLLEENTAFSHECAPRKYVYIYIYIIIAHIRGKTRKSF